MPLFNLKTFNMAIDTTPSTVATNALQAIPFSSLIGAPLDACIQAQANAAKTSWEFINEVGLTIDPDTGEKKAINVTFQYNNNGQMTTLVVPLLTIVPIPYLAIDKVSIDFMANISAASSSVEETTSDTELGIDATAEAAFKVGPFSLSIKANANYSSKQSSKSSQESKYAVEYTMNVHVEGGQADMPQGLGTILNILQGSISSVSPGDTVSIAPASVVFDKTNTNTLQVTVKNLQGLLASGTEVKLYIDDPDLFETPNVAVGVPMLKVLNDINDNKFNRVSKPYYRRYKNKLRRKTLELSSNSRSTTKKDLSYGLVATDQPDATAVTDSNGTVIFRLNLSDKALKTKDAIQGNFLVVGDVPNVGSSEDGNQYTPEEQKIPYIIFPVDSSVSLEASSNNLVFDTSNATQDLTIKAKEGNEYIKTTVDIQVQIETAGVDADDVFDKIKINGTAGSSNITASGDITDADVGVTFTLSTLTAGYKNCKGSIMAVSEDASQIYILFEVKDGTLTATAAKKSTSDKKPRGSKK